MQIYEHSFANVEDYLHHRPPYLMVDRVVSIEDSRVETEKYFSGDEFFALGHFPGATVFPGAMMQELTTQSAGILIAAKYNPMPRYNTQDPQFNEYALGVLVRLNQAKYTGFARPGDVLSVDVKLKERVGSMFEFSAKIMVSGQTIMRNSFRLINIESKLLTRPTQEKRSRQDPSD